MGGADVLGLAGGGGGGVGKAEVRVDDVVILGSLGFRV